MCRGRMQSILSSLVEMGTSKDWLVTANFILSVLLALWMFRYRRLYFASREEQNNSKDLIENLSEGIYRSSPEGRQLSANRALVRLNGYDNEAEMLASVGDIGEEWYVQPTRRDEFRKALLKRGIVSDFVSEIYRHKTRERIWVTESARLVYHRKTGRPLYYEGSVREITETVQRLRLEEQFRKLTKHLPVGLFQFARHPDGRHEVLYLSEGASRISGIPVEEQIARPELFSELIAPEHRDLYAETVARSAERLEPWDIEFRLRSRDGAERWAHINALPEAAGDRIVWHGYISDISVRKRQEMEIEALAYFDPLTRLPNRRRFLNRMGQVISTCERRGETGALLFIDLDNFKTLNDTQGHDIGDEFLVQVADRLRRCINSGDMVARIGGDEFVVLLEQTGPAAAGAARSAIMMANQILSSLREEFELGELRHMASASVGVVVFDGREKRADEILKRADIAMYQAKASGRDGVALFDPVSLDKESERYRLLADLRTAFVRGELDLYLQPQIDDAGRIAGAEALVRWNHPRLGMILPDQFIALAEQFGLAAELARFVFDKGMAILARWQAAPRTSNLRLALNVSVQCFASDDFIPLVSGLISRHGIDATKLTFELTEHVMAKDQERIATRMHEVKRLGVRLSLDDFGTGYSSLAYLKQLPFDEVKIDGGFVADIETAESDRALVKTILAMARTLGLTAVAEHVENVRQEAFLRAFGCDYFQGFLYGRAMPADKFLALFEENRAKNAGSGRTAARA